MSLTLLFHPLSSFCQKVLMGLYELDTPFTKQVVDLFDDEQRRALEKLWPIGKFPVLRDEARDVTVAESNIILEYLDQSVAVRESLIPQDRDAARECRMRDRFFDLYMNTPVGKIVTDKLRPEPARDLYGVEQAKAQLETAYVIADDWLRTGPWALGESFSMADCAAAPALLYANYVVPFRERFTHLAAYYDRLAARPSFARVLSEARPYWSMFPG
ncbi:MAG: glutathione S-transferase family protein [Myxococcales bacterium]